MAVLKLYEDACLGRSSEPDQPRDVRQVAFGLACIKRCLDDYARALNERGKPGDWEASAIGDALSIVDALLTKRKHPVWDFIDGLTKSGVNTKALNGIDWHRQAFVVGVAKAYDDASGIGFSASVRKVVAECASADVPLDSGQIEKSWNANRRDDEQWIKAVEACKGTVLQSAERLQGDLPLPEKVLRVGAHLIQKALSGPTVGSVE